MILKGWILAFYEILKTVVLFSKAYSFYDNMKLLTRCPRVSGCQVRRLESLYQFLSYREEL